MRGNKIMKKVFSGGMIVLVALAMSGAFSVEKAQALALSVKSDLMSRLQISAASNHTITFTQDAGTSLAAGETLTLQFDPTAQGFGLTSLSATDPLDYDIKVGGTEESVVAAGGCASNDAIEVTTVNTTTDTITFTACSSYTVGAAGAIIEIQIGTNATSPTAGDTQITNPSGTGTKTITIGGNFGDTGNILMEILTDDTVNITATVAETINFEINDVEIGFGALNGSGARWANAAATGSDTDVSAHTIIVGTNADGGYSVTYTGATLTGPAGTIDALEAGVVDDANGTPGSEQFALSFDKSGDALITSGYDHATNPDWKFDADPTSPVEVVHETGPSADETISAYYLANIATLTEAGSYSTDITYIATATF